MPFTSLLKELVSGVEGALGALILDSDGEAVQWYSPANGDRLRLRSAYLSSAVQACRSATCQMKLGDPGVIVVRYDGAGFVIRELSSGYYLILELEPFANFAEAAHLIEPAIPLLRAEIDS